MRWIIPGKETLEIAKKNAVLHQTEIQFYSTGLSE